MPKLQKLKTLGLRRSLDLTRVQLFLPAEPPTTPDEEDDIVLVAPFDSVEEQWGHNFLVQQDPRWETHVQFFGGRGIRGGTEADEYHPLLRTIIQLDGPPHLLPGKKEQDEYLRRQFIGLGIKVLGFDFTTFRDFKARFPAWVQENVY